MASKRIQNFEKYSGGRNGERLSVSVGVGISTSAVKTQKSSAGRFVSFVFLAICIMSALAMVAMAGAI